MSILLTGGTGFLGGLLAAQLLVRTPHAILLPIRGHHRREELLARLKKLLLENQDPIPENLEERVSTFPLPPPEGWAELRGFLENKRCHEILHCAGCLDYFDKVRLKEVNLDMTSGLLEVGKSLSVNKFIFISSAFSSGYSENPVAETLHPEPPEDPTDYTWTKRHAEAQIGASGVPYLIVRPSIVVGDSRDGRYGGKPYGIYQVVGGYERLLSDRYLPTLHAVAPHTPLHLIHQDAFQAGFFAAYETLPKNSIVHLVSRPETLPTVRDLYSDWMEICAHPREVYFYQKISQVPLGQIERRERILMEFAEVNIEIASHHWNFQTQHLEGLRQAGLHFADATPKTLRICLNAFAQRSPRIQAFLKNFQKDFSPNYRAIEIGL